MEPFLVEQVDQDIKTKIVIDYPVAIKLMDRVAWINLYENDEGYDTLMKLLKMKNWGDRGEIYRHYDIRGYYGEGIRPILVDNRVTIIDTIKHEQFVTIKDAGEIYIIDLNRYRKDDGVLMFTPGKKPIYWTMQKEEENCFSYWGFPKWYYNCR